MRTLNKISCLVLVFFFVMATAYYENAYQRILFALSGLFFAFYSVVASFKKSNKKRGFILKGEKLIQI